MDQEQRLSITTLSLIVILAAVATTGILYFFGPQKSTTGKTATTSRTAFNFFPNAQNRPAGQDKTAQISGDNATFTPIFSGSTTVPAEPLPKALKLFKITENPVAGGSFATLNGSSSAFYVDRSTGHLYRVLLDTKQVERITNTTIPLTQDMFWGSDGKNIRVVLRSLKNDNINNFSGFIKLATPSTATSTFTGGEIKGGNWPEGIIDLAVSPNKKQLFTLRKVKSGFAGIVSDWDLKNAKTIFTSNNNEWLVSWPTQNSILLTTKPAANLLGLVYRIDTKTGKQTNLLNNINGLTTNLSPDGQKLLYSESQGNSLNTKILNLKNNKTEVLNLKTLPEKCSWSKESKILYCAVPNIIRSAKYPDQWYRGELSFSDSLWQLNTETGETKLLINTETSNLSASAIDIVNIFLNDKENTIFFTNKVDGTLWSFEI